MDAPMQNASTDSGSCTGIVAGSGSLPFAVADRLAAKGQRPVIFGIRGYCDASRIEAYPHHWIALGQLGRLTGLLIRERCRDVIFLGGVVRPALSEIRMDLGTLLAIPKILSAFRGGDDHLLTGIGKLVEGYGLRMVGVHEVAPELTMPDGRVTRSHPDERSLADIAKGVDVLKAISPFDVGQGVIVIDGNVVCVEDIEGTDAMLARAARLRRDGRLRASPGRGVLVKMPKVGQNLKFDMPTVGSITVEGARDAGLAGIAAVAGQTLFADPQEAIRAADKAGLFIFGMPA